MPPEACADRWHTRVSQGGVRWTSKRLRACSARVSVRCANSNSSPMPHSRRRSWFESVGALSIFVSVCESCCPRSDM